VRNVCSSARNIRHTILSNLFLSGLQCGVGRVADVPNFSPSRREVGKMLALGTHVFCVLCTRVNVPTRELLSNKFMCPCNARFSGQKCCSVRKNKYYLNIQILGAK